MLNFLDTKQCFKKKFLEAKEKIGEREDLTQELQDLPEYRRLDSLARLLESITNCVAVSIFEQKLYIAFNKILSSNREEDNKKLKGFIEEITSYFFKLSNNNLIQESERRCIFGKICNADRFISLIKGAKMNIDITSIERIVDEIFYTGVSTFEEVINRYGRDSTVAFIFMSCMILWEDFTKLEKAIKMAIKGDFSKISSEQLAAFKTQAIILDTTEECYHAEMHIIFHLLSLKIQTTRDTYIGISKLCCLNCHTMINVINDTLIPDLNQSFVFLVIGWHDLAQQEFPIPENILSLYNLDFKIDLKKLALEKAKQKKSYPKKVIMKQARSDSANSQDNEIYLLEKNKLELIEIKKAARLFNNSLSIEENAKIAEIGLLFHNQESLQNSYVEFFNPDLANINEVQPAVLGFLEIASNCEDLKRLIDGDYKLLNIFFKNNLISSPIYHLINAVLDELWSAFIKKIEKDNKYYIEPIEIIDHNAVAPTLPTQLYWRYSPQITRPTYYSQQRLLPHPYFLSEEERQQNINISATYHYSHFFSRITSITYLPHWSQQQSLIFPQQQCRRYYFPTTPMTYSAHYRYIFTNS